MIRTSPLIGALPLINVYKSVLIINKYLFIGLLLKVKNILRKSLQLTTQLTIPKAYENKCPVRGDHDDKWIWGEGRWGNKWI